MSGTALKNSDPFNLTELETRLAFENEDLVKRAIELKAMAEKWEKAPPIASEGEAEDLAAFMKQCAQLVGDNGSGNVRRTALKKPYDDCAGTVQTFFKTKILDLLAPHQKAILAKANAWLDKKRADAAAAAKILADEARKKMEEARSAADVVTAGKMLKEAEAAAKPAAVRSDFGAKIHQTSRWDFDVIDASLIPRRYLVLDRTAVMAFIKTGTEKDPVTIAGITVKRVRNAVGGG